MDSSGEERLHLELELLTSMYPDTLQFNEKSRELTFSSTQEATDKMVLRLDPTYPLEGRPQILSARSRDGRDIREAIKSTISRLCREMTTQEDTNPGEILDAVLAEFVEIIQANETDGNTYKGETAIEAVEASKTVVIWLHHLLATSKRKLALHPSSNATQIQGLTKPGYPGVLVFSGTKSAVDEHVNELKTQNWQAFAIRYEEAERWHFNEGIQEVETMAGAVQLIEEGRREVFLKVIGVK